MQYLLATTNKAKIKYYGSKLKEFGIDIVTLNDLNIKLSVNETGSDPIENAIIKANTYFEASKIPTIAIDEGLYFENVDKNLNPGVNVRRVNGKRLNDLEMIEYYVNIVNTLGKNGILKGYFLKGIAIKFENEIYTFSSKAYRIFTNKISSIIDEGYPLASIQIIEKYHKFKSELTEIEEKQTIDLEHKDIFEFIVKIVNEKA